MALLSCPSEPESGVQLDEPGEPVLEVGHTGQCLLLSGALSQSDGRSDVQPTGVVCGARLALLVL